MITQRKPNHPGWDTGDPVIAIEILATLQVHSKVLQHRSINPELTQSNGQRCFDFCLSDRKNANGKMGHSSKQGNSFFNLPSKENKTITRNLQLSITNIVSKYKLYLGPLST